MFSLCSCILIFCNINLYRHLPLRFFNCFLFILRVFNLSSLFSSLCLVPLYPPSAFECPPPSQWNKKLREKRKNLIVEAVVWHSESWSKPFCPFTCKCLRHWSGLSSLVSVKLTILGRPWVSSWISCCCPLLWRSCSIGPARAASSHAPADHRRVDIEVGQHITVVMGLGSFRFDQSAHSPLSRWVLNHQGVLSSIAPARPPRSVMSKGASFPPSGLGLPHLHHKGQLYCAAQTRYRGQSPKCCSWWGAGRALPLLWTLGQLSLLPQMARSGGRWEVVSPPPIPPYER